MLLQKALKRLGVLGVSASLLASPLVFADMHEEPAQDQAPMEDPGAPAGDDTMADPGAQDPASDPAAAPEPGEPAEEPGFGSEPDPMPSGDAEAQPGGETDSQAEGDEDNTW